jgi:serine protein kinase
MFIATDPNPDGASSLIGSVDQAQLIGKRGEVAGKAFRLDGELNIANRGLIEFVEMFKADRHLLTTLLGLAQEQIIKNEKFGSLYADEVIIGHSNEKDFDAFALEPTSEALRDRIVAIQVPYTLKVSEEVKIYQKMMKDSDLEGIELAPLTLTIASVFTVLSRFEDRVQGGITLIDKMHLYDGVLPKGYSLSDIQEVKRRYPNEGMFGISPRYTMNRIGVLASSISGNCITPLAVLDSLWKGQMENVSVEPSDNMSKYTLLLQEGIDEYSRIAIKEVQRAFDPAFEDTAQMLVDGYVKGASEYVRDGGIRTSAREDTIHLREQDMREMERVIGVTERDKDQFRKEINLVANKLEEKEIKFTYLVEPRLRNAIEERLLPTRRKLERSLARPRFAKQRAEWSQRRAAIISRLMLSYGYSDLSARDLVDFVTEILKKKAVIKILKHGGIEWGWPLYLSPSDVNGEN